MLDSYFQEVQQRRKRKRIFWIVVLILATFLFFFFQGKYISIKINWEQIFSSTGNTDIGESNFHIQSFGIIKVKTFPSDTSITINNEPHYSDEKVWKNYGTYTISLSKKGYIPGQMLARIDAKKDFYIDEVTLLPEPQYEQLQKFPSSNIYAIGNNTWIVRDTDDLILYKNTFQTGAIIFSGTGMIHIGEGKFLSGSTLQEYSTVEKQWNALKIPGLDAYISLCNKSHNTLSYSEGVFSCSKSDTIFTLNGETLTGVVLRGKNSIQTHDALILGNQSLGEITTFPLFKKQEESTQTGASQHAALPIFDEKYLLNPSSLWIPLYNTWYTTNTGELIPIDMIETPPTHENQPGMTIRTKLDSIAFLDEIGKNIIAIGTKNSKQYLSLIDISEPQEARLMPFPDIPLQDIRLHEYQGNYFLKTRDALLFFYANNDEISWIVDGKILAFGETFALYEKDQKIWIANWKRQTTENK